jgi:hypothetical protein
MAILMTVIKSLKGEIKNAKDDAVMHAGDYDANNALWKQYNELVATCKLKCKAFEEMMVPADKKCRVQNVAVKAIVKQCTPHIYVDLCDSSDDESKKQDEEVDESK